MDAPVRLVGCVVMRRAFAAFALVVALHGGSTAAAPPPLPGHPLLVDRPGLRVYGPGAPRSGCPRLLPLPAHALATTKHVVALAMPPFMRRARPPLDGREPIVKVGLARHSGYDQRAGDCGRTTWTRSVVASVVLPHVEKLGASVSQLTFAVGRTRQGWVLWGWIH